DTLWMRKYYPSDISREQFEQVRLLLEGARKKTRPRTVDLYEVFCAVLYLLKSGCQWRLLPDSFPNWRTVHSVLDHLERARRGGSEPAGAGVKKNPLARFVPDRGAALAARS